MYQNDPFKCLTGEVRLSYVHLAEKAQRMVDGKPEGEPKYSVVLLIPKTDTITKADLDSALAACADDAVRTKWGGVRPPVISQVIHDGDGLRRDGSPYAEECKGHWVLSVSSTRKPDVVDISNINVPLAPQDIYSGMYARVTVRAFAYNTRGNKGVSFGLGNVLKIRDGEPLSGGATASTDFAGIGASVPRVDPLTGMPIQ